MANIKYVVAEDWQGLYIDGWLKIEGHSIPTFQAMNLVAKHCDGDVLIEKVYVNQDWIEDEGNLPNQYKDIPEEMLI